MVIVVCFLAFLVWIVWPEKEKATKSLSHEPSTHVNIRPYIVTVWLIEHVAAESTPKIRTEFDAYKTRRT